MLHRGNSYGRGFVPADDKILEEHLTSVGNLRTLKDTSTKLVKKTVKDINTDQVVVDSQQPSTSKQHQSNEKESEISERGSRKRHHSLSKTDMSKNIGSDLVTSTCHDEQKPQDGSNFQEMEVNDLESKKSKGLSQGTQSSGTRCMQQTVSIILGHPHINVTKIKDVINGDIPYKYRVLGRVDNFFPNTSNVNEFLQLYCSMCNFLSDIPKKGEKTLPVQKQRIGVSYYFCPQCNENATKLQDKNRSVLQYIYMMRFQLSDSSGSILVLMWKDEAVTFFRGIDPEDLLSSESLWNELQDELTHLCSVDKPMIECCIKSYTVEDQTKYQIFDTCLV